MVKQARKNQRTDSRRSRNRSRTRGAATDASTEAIKSAEEVALAAFASGLKIAAAFGTVAAKTTSLALESLATGADKFSELVKGEALASSRASPTSSSPRKRRKVVGDKKEPE